VTNACYLAARGIYVGISAWTEPTLVESGRFYPRDATTAESRLRYYATEFPIVEVDSTFYAPPNERVAQAWVDRTPKGFVFDVKSHRLLTHHPTPPSSLWRELRDELPPELRAKPNIYAADLGWESLTVALDRFLAGIEPLVSAGRLGVVLFQFPRYVYPSRRSYGYLEWLASRLDRVAAAVEFRQSRWMDDDHRESTLALLAANRLSYVSVDEPQGFPSSMPPIAASTAGVAVVRFHGRNRERWQVRTPRAADRFAYDYTPEELGEWVPRIESLHEQTDSVHVLMNNCYSDYAVRAARVLSTQLIAHHPEGGTGSTAFA
jgi:uncharacterized protein YecE (DUF72 family)